MGTYDVGLGEKYVIAFLTSGTRSDRYDVDGVLCVESRE